jgi:hypothetical protein
MQSDAYLQSMDKPIWNQDRKAGRWIAAIVCLALLAAMSRLDFFKDYCAALYGHWIALMSGVISVAITFWEKVRNSLGKYVFYAIALMCVFLAGFQAWQDEHRALQTEQARNGNPSLSATIDQYSFTYGRSDSESIVTIFATIRNGLITI